MLGQAVSLKLGNQKLVSVDSIALFGIIGLLAAIGAIMTHNFQNDSIDYIDSFVPVNISVSDVEFNTTCYYHPDIECVPSYTLDVTVNCTGSPMVCDDPSSDVPLVRSFDFGDDAGSWNATLQQFIIPVIRGDTSSVLGYMSVDNNQDFRFFANAVCQEWCDNTKWMYRLCVAVAALCVGFSALVFLYLYLGCILERLYPRRRLERLANLLLMRGEEAPKLERVNTGSKSESIRPDLKEY